MSLFVFLVWSKLLSMTVFGYVALPTAKRVGLRSASHQVVCCNGRQRVSDDSDETMVPLQENDERESSQVEIEVPSMSLDALLLPSADCNVNQIGPTALAYIGDVVFELMVRARHVWPTRRTCDLQQRVVSLVRAEHQAKLLAMLRDSSSSYQLSPKEEQILSRGRNSASATRNRKNAAVYQDATALEALIGYHYLSDRPRCEDLLNWIYAHLDQVDE